MTGCYEFYIYFKTVKIKSFKYGRSSSSSSSSLFPSPNTRPSRHTTFDDEYNMTKIKWSLTLMPLRSGVHIKLYVRILNTNWVLVSGFYLILPRFFFSFGLNIRSFSFFIFYGPEKPDISWSCWYFFLLFFVYIWNDGVIYCFEYYFTLVCLCLTDFNLWWFKRSVYLIRRQSVNRSMTIWVGVNSFMPQSRHSFWSKNKITSHNETKSLIALFLINTTHDVSLTLSIIISMISILSDPHNTKIFLTGQ